MAARLHGCDGEGHPHLVLLLGHALVDPGKRGVRERDTREQEEQEEQEEQQEQKGQQQQAQEEEEERPERPRAALLVAGG